MLLGFLLASSWTPLGFLLDHPHLSPGDEARVGKQARTIILKGKRALLVEVVLEFAF